MLLREQLLAEYRQVIDTILHATTLPKSDESLDNIVKTLVRSLNTSGTKEPTQSPLYLMALALTEYQKSETWPPKFAELVNELIGLTGLPYSTVRSSMTSFHWNIPAYLVPKKHKGATAERVTVHNEPTLDPPKEDVKFEWCQVKPQDIVKLKEDYHVVIDFGAFKITIEKEKHE